jgi:hypothetical protein|tara:strand:- start:406 stop:1035 length:630 start_codon:yes stop_codon:yes gene_type:complete
VKKVLLLIFAGLLVTSCGTSYSNYQDWTSGVYTKGYKYSSEARSLNNINSSQHAGWGASVYSQSEANQIALQYCNKNFYSCVIYKEGYTNVYEQRQREKAEAEERQLISNIKDKAIAECKEIGFSEGSTEFADCNLKLSTLYKEEAIEEKKIRAAEEQAEAAARQARAAEAQAKAAQQQAAAAAWRNNQQMMQKGMDMVTGRCTLGIDC